MKIVTTSLVALLAFASLGSAEKKQKLDIVDTAVAAGSFNTLAAALKAGGLVDALKGDGPFTVFAPTDEAFAKLPKGTVETLLKPENKSKLVDILTYHVVSGRVPSKKAVKLDSATALNKKSIKLEVKDGSLYLNSSKVVKADIKCSNGVIHVIDSVLIPSAGGKTGKNRTDDLMVAAIEKGVKLFNHGQHGACADIYEMAALAGLKMDSKALSSDRKAILTTALKASQSSQCDTTRAWTMRRALDRIMASTK